MTDAETDLSHWIDVLPHKASMSLLSGVRELNAHSAVTEVAIDAMSTFHVHGHGVPAWVALEYIGQTAALIGVYAASELRGSASDASSSEGFLLASRNMDITCPWFIDGDRLIVSASQAGTAGASLATFNGTVSNALGDTLVVASLSVWRGDPDQGSTATSTARPAVS